MGSCKKGQQIWGRVFQKMKATHEKAENSRMSWESRDGFHLGHPLTAVVIYLGRSCLTTERSASLEKLPSFVSLAPFLSVLAGAL